MHKKTSLLSLLLLVATLPACLGDGCSSCKKQEAPQEVVTEEIDLASMPETTEGMAGLTEEVTLDEDAAEVTAPEKI